MPFCVCVWAHKCVVYTGYILVCGCRVTGMVFVCVCVCVREREREMGGRERGGEREGERERVCESV